MGIDINFIRSSKLKLSFKILCILYLVLNIPVQLDAHSSNLHNMTCNAGRDTIVFVCIDTEIIDVTQYLSANADTNGFWVDGENTFDPSTFNSKTFVYIVDDGSCDPDTAVIQLKRRQAAGLSTFINRVCFGDSILFNDVWYLEPGFYDDTIKYVNTQCDSVVERLAFFSTPATTFQSIDTTLCAEDSIFFAGQWRTEPVMIDTTLLYSESSCDSLVGTLNLSFLPFSDFSISGIDTVCQNESIILSASPSISTYQWSTGSIEPTAEIIQGGSYNVTATDNNACELVKTILVPSYPITTLSGTNFYFVTTDTLLTLDVTSNNPIEITNWSSDEVDINCINCLDPQIFITDTTNINLIAIDQNGCESNFNVFVEYQKEAVPPVFYTPSIFSPNSDQIQNRAFYIQSKETFTYSLKIYDRWGNFIYQNDQLTSNDPDLSWDGMFKGQVLDNGVFLYHVQVGDVVRVGTVSLMR